MNKITFDTNDPSFFKLRQAAHCTPAQLITDLNSIFTKMQGMLKQIEYQIQWKVQELNLTICNMSSSCLGKFCDESEELADVDASGMRSFGNAIVGIHHCLKKMPFQPEKMIEYTESNEQRIAFFAEFLVENDRNYFAKKIQLIENYARINLLLVETINQVNRAVNAKFIQKMSKSKITEEFQNILSVKNEMVKLTYESSCSSVIPSIFLNLMAIKKVFLLN